MKFRIIMCFCTILWSCGFAQQQNSLMALDQKTVKLFFEKSYLQTDRTYYSNGENLWFAAYLVNGKSSSLTGTSRNLYVELISPSAHLIERKLIRIDGGLGNGDFKLSDSLASGWYTIRAYTNWMRNFGEHFVFQKQLYLSNTLTGKNAGAEKKEQAIRQRKNKNILFFPEGGSLVAGLTSIVAFKTEDEFGNGFAAKGSVVSAKGDTITTFQSTEVGMGIFAFTPAAEESYHVEGTFGDEKFSSALPGILKKGLSLHLTVDSVNIKAVIAANALLFEEAQQRPLTVIIKHAGDPVYTGTINLTKNTISVIIPTTDLPQGIAAVTIFDHLGRPNCESLIYIQPKNKVNLSIIPDKEVYSAREKVSLKIKALDFLGQPVKTTFSLAAVDGLVPADWTDIVSYLMLQSELKGEIKNAAQYFDPKNPSRFKQLNLLLLTQGWRDYLWKKIADSAIKITYLPEPGITIHGLVREKLTDRPMPGMNITVFGSNFIGNKIYTAKTDAKGNYFLDGLQWYGNQPIKLSSQDNSGKKGGWLQLDSVFKPFPIQLRASRFSSVDASITNELTKRMTYNRTYKTGDAILLNEVKIVSGKSEKVAMFDQTLSTFGYKDQVFNISAADHSYKGLEHYLLTNVKGAQPLDDGDTTGSEGINFLANGKKVRPRIVVNGKEDLFQRIDYYSLTMDQINQIIVKHLVGNTGDDVYVINLNLKDSALRGPNLNLLNVDLNGYYETKTFYSPTYVGSFPAPNKDLRTTLFWAPMVKTDANGEATISYYNGDEKMNVVIKAEGITEKGMALSTKATYKIQ
jgi:hypothetical protein